MMLPPKLPANLGVLSELAPELAQTFVSLSGDIALVLDAQGVIRSVAHAGAEPFAPGAREWVGRAWVDTVTGETRDKITQSLGEVGATGLARKREINHPTADGADIAVAYTAIRLGERGPVLAVGRDLRSIAAIQQRFLDAQQEMERGYWRARQAEARYRLLFQVATDAVLVVDGESLQILEANQAACQLFEMRVEQVAGRPAVFGFESHSRAAVQELLISARASGQPAEIRARLAGKITSTSVVATPFRADTAMRLLVRVRTMDMPGTATDLNATLARLVDNTHDGVVVTDSSGRIQIANPAFLKLVRMGSEAAVKGRALMDWVGVSDQQLAELLQRVRRQGITGRLLTGLLSSDAQLSDVEISAALLTEGDQECIGFTIHPVVASTPLGSSSLAQLGAAIERLGERIGTLPFSELLEEANGLARQHFVRLALERCANDTQAAAALLGVDDAALLSGAIPTAPAGSAKTNSTPGT